MSRKSRPYARGCALGGYLGPADVGIKVEDKARRRSYADRLDSMNKLGVGQRGHPARLQGNSPVLCVGITVVATNGQVIAEQPIDLNLKA